MNEFRKCKICGREIPNGMSSCPFCCNEESKNFFQRHKIFTGIIIAIFLIWCLGVFRETVGQIIANRLNGNTATNTTVNSSNTAIASPTPQAYKIGDTITNNSVALTVTDVKKDSGGFLDKPKDGNEYVIVYVKIKNVSDSKQTYNPYDFHLQNSKGQLLNVSISAEDGNTELQETQLLPNGEVEGSIGFETPTNDNNLILLFRDSILHKEMSISLTR